MAKKKSTDAKAKNREAPAAAVEKQPIVETIEKNFMPYAMSVIVARAIPEIDGFKPSHRKLLYTMYKMGLLTGAMTKSANVVGQTMQLNPHGSAAIYETLVRLTRGNESLLHPFIDSKGSFGKHYSSDMAYAAPRYTMCRLDPFCSEIFGGINENAVDLVPNYDNTTTEPVHLPTSFPNILVTPNVGIAVGMASNICSFNLSETCDAAMQMLLNPDTTTEQLLDILRAPDFPCGGILLYDREEMGEIYRTGRGSFRIRAKYVYDPKANCIDIIEIPYSTSIEQILKRISDLVKDNKLREITDIRDEIDVEGFKLTLDLRRGVDPDKLMLKLYKMTTLEDSFDCNFNVLIDGVPQVLGVRGLLEEWIRFRVGCVKRQLSHQLDKKNGRLHLLIGLGKILLDIDKAIKIIRETKLDREVVPNLMSGFSIDEAQAEFVADIKLRNINREYIMNQTKNIETLKKETAELSDIIGDEKKLKKQIIKELREVKAKYGKPRLTQILYAEDVEVYDESDEEPDDTLSNIFFTSEGYFKRISAASLRMSSDHKLKEGDKIIFSRELAGSTELIFITDRAQAYKAHVSDFENQKASELGDYIPTKLGMDEDERALFMAAVADYKKDNYNLIFIYENGKGVRVPILAYQTQQKRRKLQNAYNAASPLTAVMAELDKDHKPAEIDIILINSLGRGAVISSGLIPQLTTRSSGGNKLLNLRPGQTLTEASDDLSRFGDVSALKRTK
ncbi:MAG: topoisomerase IV, partial [Clostridiales bacterium]|nr:topoisomerase IV [Clostridiales bacterium]